MRAAVLACVLTCMSCGEKQPEAATKDSASATPAASVRSAADECALLIATINGYNQTIAPLDSSTPPADPVQAWQALDAKLAALQLADAALAKHAADYRASLAETIALTKDLEVGTPSASATASAGAAPDAAFQALEARAKKIRQNEVRLVREINALCDKAE